jgi:hypothetical protein
MCFDGIERPQVVRDHRRQFRRAFAAEPTVAEDGVHGGEERRIAAVLVGDDARLGAGGE